ncbi:peptidase M3-like protein [Anaeroplasma bactoclasticum]|jgi:hypothetical protein|uniref:Peptidase M3-like protein n=1 Tax=Anaeroplasma bactoclasticum TaxID=2088 RepID=A0A397RNK4_9MOLU|nr:M3 family metallopeptidase [Anaeroplasma bactoclasticum]RIA75920.1 peptidase M3-like protein [Anaeroplasma bactoclasticum]
MKKIKQIALLCLIGASAMSLSSCLIRLDANDTRVKKDLTYTWSDEDYNKLHINMQRFSQALKNNNDLELVGSWQAVQRTAYACATYRTIENINYAAGDDSAYEKYLKFQNIVAEVAKWQEALYSDMYESSYRDSFFSGYTKEEIEELINSVKPDKYYEIEEEQEALIKEYNDLAKDEIQLKTSDIYLSLVKNYKEEATLLGYDNYMDYAYKNIYEREYTPSEVLDFTTYVKNHIVPMMLEIAPKVKEAASGLNESEKQKYNTFKTANFNTMKDTFNLYATFIGDSFKTNANYVFNNGYIRYGSENANIDGAFTAYLYMSSLDQPIIYFGPSYTDIMTFVHEFGHYNNFKVNKATNLSYDLAETHSQGNELLFLAWLDKNDESYSDNLMRAIHLSEVYEALTTIVLATMVNDFEYRVYTSSNDLTIADFDTYYKEAGDALGGYDTIMECLYQENNGKQIDYWKLVTIQNPAYYISYAMSKIPSLEIYSIAKEDLAKARNSYKKTYTLDKNLDLTDFLGVLDSAGLYSPFKEEAFTLIEKLK